MSGYSWFGYYGFGYGYGGGAKIVFRDTLTGLRVSTVAGTAFIDNAGATVPTFADGNHSIEIYCPTGCLLRGVMSAAGTGETVSATELLPQDLTSGWSVVSNATIDDSNSYTTSDTGYIRTTTGVHADGALVKFVVAGTIGAGSFSIRSGNVAGNVFLTGFGTAYGTGYGGAKQIVFYNSAAATTDFTSYSGKQVLTPSASGALIVSAKGGADRNWAVNQWVAGSYNAAQNFCIIRKLR